MKGISIGICAVAVYLALFVALEALSGIDPLAPRRVARITAQAGPNEKGAPGSASSVGVSRARAPG